MAKEEQPEKEPKARSHEDIFYGNDADDIEDAAMDAARDVFGHAVGLAVRRTYMVKRNPMHGFTGETSTPVDKMYYAKVIVDEVPEDEDTEKKQCHFGGCFALFDPTLAGFDPGDGRGVYSGWVYPTDDESFCPAHDHAV